jgi:hypothetical protein
LQINTRKKCRYQRRLSESSAQFAIGLCNGVRGIAMSQRAGMQKRKQVRHPDARGEALAGNVADDYTEGAVEFDHLEEISRQVTHRKNFPGDFEVTAAEFARGAQAALNLSGFEKAAVHRGLLAAQLGDFGLQAFYLIHGVFRVAVVRIGASRASRTVLHFVRG